MSFQEIAKRVRAQAGAHDIRLPMARLNDAIALACYGKKYAAVIAAERAGHLPPIPNPPPHIAAAALQYRISEHALGLSLHDGIDGPAKTKRDGTVDLALEWLSSKYPVEYQQLEMSELFGLADEQLVRKVLSHPGYQRMTLFGFAEWVIAEGVIQIEKRPVKISDLLRTSKSRPAWNSRQGAYIAALAAAPLRLYLIESVIAGYSMTLRPLGGEGSLVQVSERSGSRPEAQGSVVGARVIQRNEHLELAGGIYLFDQSFGTALAASVRDAADDSEVSREIRAGWFTQFDRPTPTVTLAGSGEPVRLITDDYRCEDLNALSMALANAPQVVGDVDLGWSYEETEDGRSRSMCSISVDDEAPDRIHVFYQSEGRAARLRPWFESLAGPLVSFLERESLDPMEAAMAVQDEQPASEKIRIAPSSMSEMLSQAFQQMYAGWSDKPLPALDNKTPREMLATPGGESRVREVLALYESNERRMAHNERRPPISFAFLYDALRLAETPAQVVSKSQGLHPEQFEVGEAWVVFKLIDTPLETADKGRINLLGLMDARSTMILNLAPLSEGADFSEVEAANFITRLKYPCPRAPKKLLIASNIAVTELEAAARRFGVSICQMDERELLPIIGRALESIGDQWKGMLGEAS